MLAAGTSPFEACFDNDALCMVGIAPSDEGMQAASAADLFTAFFDELSRIVHRVESMDQAVNALNVRIGCANKDLVPTQESFARLSLACAGSNASVAEQVREAIDVAGVGLEE